MAIRRIQNRIAESRFLLPTTAIIALCICLLAGLVQKQQWIPFLLFAIATYFFAELNNTNALLRIYSRTVSSSFMLLTCTIVPLILMEPTPLLPLPKGVGIGYLFTRQYVNLSSYYMAIAQLCMILFYYIMFRCYMLRRSAPFAFFGYLMIGVISTFFVQILFFVPFLWILTATNLRTLHVKSFIASCLGLITPYWLGGAYLMISGEFNRFTDHFVGLITFQPLFDYTAINEHQFVTFALVAILAITGIIHFFRHSYLDKIRIRMLYEIFIIIDILCIIFIVLQPQHYYMLMMLIIVNTSPLIAHFITLTRTRITNIAFLTILFLVFAVIAYNLWMPSLIF